MDEHHERSHGGIYWVSLSRQRTRLNGRTEGRERFVSDCATAGGSDRQKGRPYERKGASEAAKGAGGQYARQREPGACDGDEFRGDI